MKKSSSIRAAAAAFLLMMAMAVTTSALSFFVSPVCGDLGIGRGSFAVYYSLMTAAGAFSTSFLGQYINRKGVRNILALSGLWCSAGLMLFSYSNSLWMFYLAASAMGFFATSCMNLCANVIVQQAFTDSKAAGVLGVVMAGSGVGGMVFSLVIPAVLEGFGWRIGYRFLAVCWLVLNYAAFFLLGKQETSGNIGSSKALPAGMTREAALRSPEFYMMAIAIFIFAACCGIQQQIPSLLEDMGFGASQTGVMVSVMTAGLAVGKIFQGLLYSWIGVKKGGSILVVMFAVSFLLLLSPALVYPGLIFLAFGMGVVTTLMPTAARFVFGAREYASIWSLLATASSVGSFLANPVWGMVYDGFGSYTPALIVSPVLLAGALCALLVALRKQ